MPLTLVALSLIPVIAGAVRLVDVSTGSTYMPQDAHHPEMPVALIVHIVSATAYSLLGRVLVPLGLAVALSALWLTLVYPTEANTGPLLYWSRLLFGSAMVACLVLGSWNIRARRITAHRAWMIRGYALGLGAGTQVVTIGLGQATFGTTTSVTDAVAAAAWAINLAIAEGIVRRPWTRRQRRTTSCRSSEPPDVTPQQQLARHPRPLPGGTR